MVTTKQLLERLQAEKPARSHWARGVQAYSCEMVEWLGVREVPYLKIRLADEGCCTWPDFQTWLLAGAESWAQYASGYSLVWDEDICARLMTPSEQRRYRNGMREPSEGWLNMQERALRNAAWHIFNVAKSLQVELS